MSAINLRFSTLPSTPRSRPLPPFSGLSKSFPLDSSLFDSWLAQSVQITADDMLSQWTLGAQHGDKSGSLLSDQVGLQQEQTRRKIPLRFLSKEEVRGVFFSDLNRVILQDHCSHGGINELTSSYFA